MSFMHEEAYPKWLATQSHEMQCYCSREQFLSQGAVHSWFPGEEDYDGDTWSDAAENHLSDAGLPECMKRFNTQFERDGKGFSFFRCNVYIRSNRHEGDPLYYLITHKFGGSNDFSMFFYGRNDSTPFTGGWFFSRQRGWIMFEPFIRLGTN